MSSPLARLFSYLRPFRKDYLLATLYSVLNKLFDIAPEILIGVAIDVVVQKKNSWLAQIGIIPIESQLLTLGLLTLMTWGFESLFQYFYSVKWRNLAQSVEHAFRMDSVAHVQKIDQKAFDQERTGNLLSILNDDINQLERFLEDGVNQIIQILFSTVSIGIIFFVFAPKVAVFAIIPIPFVILGAFYFQHKLSPLFLEVREKAGAIASRLTNTLTGIMTIKSLTAEEHELEEVAKTSQAYREANRKAIRLSALVTPVIRTAIMFGFVATLVYGGLLTIEGSLSVGIYGMLVFLTQRLLWPLTSLAEVTVNYQRAMASTTRIMNLIETPIAITHGGSLLKKVAGSIVFDNVSFAYDPQHPILKNFSVEIPEGKTVAFVGTTGAGKTTLLKLLFRFYDPDQGAILLDGKRIESLDIGDLRRAMGLVSQDVFLFHGSAEENIAYPERKVAPERVQEAAKLAEADDFISHLPQGYATIVGERGQKLSGGQRQRLAIAREIIKNPPILIFDEATSSVDNETEMAIQRSIERITVGRTVILIAHRLSTVRNADTIHVLKHGEIVESGRHEALLEQEGIYAALWRLQTGQHFDEACLRNQT